MTRHRDAVRGCQGPHAAIDPSISRGDAHSDSGSCTSERARPRRTVPAPIAGPNPSPPLPMARRPIAAARAPPSLAVIRSSARLAWPGMSLTPPWSDVRLVVSLAWRNRRSRCSSHCRPVHHPELWTGRWPAARRLFRLLRIRPGTEEVPPLPIRLPVSLEPVVAPPPGLSPPMTRPYVPKMHIAAREVARFAQTVMRRP